jgi:hypothetical protein
MTLQQATELLSSLFVTYPHLDNFINGLPDSQATINEWRRLVAKLNYDHGAEAIRRMKDGQADPPVKPWDVAMLPMWIRAVAGRVHDESAKFAKAEEMRRAKRQAAEHTGSASAVAFGVSRRIAMAVADCLVRGEITQQRHDEIMDYVLAMARNSPEVSPEVPADIRHQYDSPRGFFWVPGMSKKRTKKIRNTY